MAKNEIVISPSKDLDYPIMERVKVQDVYQAQGLSKLDRDIIIAAHCSKKIRDRKGEVYPDGEFKGKEIRQVEIRQHINKSILDAGLTNSWEAEDIEYLIKSVLTDVLMDFPHLTTEEVGIAFRKGSREEYGKNYGISTRAYYSWLKNYCNETKIRANKELLKIANRNEIVEPSEEEKERRHQTWLEMMYKAYNEYKETKDYKIYDLNNMFYDKLKSLGLINFSDEEREQLWKEATEQVKMNHNPLNAKNPSQRNNFLKLMKALNNNDEIVHSKITSQAKHLALRRYLNILVSKNKDLKKIIESATTKKG